MNAKALSLVLAPLKVVGVNKRGSFTYIKAFLNNKEYNICIDNINYKLIINRFIVLNNTFICFDNDYIFLVNKKILKNLKNKFDN